MQAPTPFTSPTSRLLTSTKQSGGRRDGKTKVQDSRELFVGSFDSWIHTSKYQQRKQTRTPVLFDQELDTVDTVSVTITGTGDMVCSGDSGATTQVAFLLQHGPLSDMTADIATLESTTGTPSIAVIATGQVRMISAVDVPLEGKLVKGPSNALLRAVRVA